MTELPSPLTPAESDLQDFPFMPLHVARLRDSDLAAEEDPEACWYAVLLWAASWHQLPAGSLPDNEAVLVRLCGLGRDVKTFRKHRDGALRGFIRCSDGRLYHPVVAEQVNAAWAEKLGYRDRKEKRQEIARKAAAARWSSDEQQGGNAEMSADALHDASPGNASCIDQDASCMPDAMPKGTGTGTGTGNYISQEGKPPSMARAKSSTALPDPPDDVPAEQWAGFVAMRAKIKKPLTPRAAELAFRKLQKLRDAGHDPGDVLDQSTLNSWQNLYEIKDLDNGNRHSNNRSGSGSGWIEAGRRIAGLGDPDHGPGPGSGLV